MLHSVTWICGRSLAELAQRGGWYSRKWIASRREEGAETPSCALSPCYQTTSTLRGLPTSPHDGVSPDRAELSILLFDIWLWRSGFTSLASAFPPEGTTCLLSVPSGGEQRTEDEERAKANSAQWMLLCKHTPPFCRMPKNQTWFKFSCPSNTAVSVNLAL